MRQQTSLFLNSKCQHECNSTIFIQEPSTVLRRQSGWCRIAVLKAKQGQAESPSWKVTHTHKKTLICMLKALENSVVKKSVHFFFTQLSYFGTLKKMQRQGLEYKQLIWEGKGNMVRTLGRRQRREGRSKGWMMPAAGDNWSSVPLGNCRSQYKAHTSVIPPEGPDGWDVHTPALTHHGLRTAVGRCQVPGTHGLLCKDRLALHGFSKSLRQRHTQELLGVSLFC